MSDNLEQTDQLLRRAVDGDERATDELFQLYRSRLKNMLRLRVNPRVRSRIDDSDIIQETLFEAARRLPEYASQDRQVSFYVWLRQIAGRKLIDIHRRHLGAQARDAGREVSLVRNAGPGANSESLANLFVGRMSSPSRAAMKMELQASVQKALNDMSLIDREIIALRHFEQLKNVEVAEVLGLDPSAASKRYFRAVERLKDILGDDQA